VTLNTSAYLEPGISFKESKVGCHVSDLQSNIVGSTNGHCEGR